MNASALICMTKTSLPFQTAISFCFVKPWEITWRSLFTSCSLHAALWKKEAGPMRAVPWVHFGRHRTLNSHQNVYSIPCPCAGQDCALCFLCAAVSPFATPEIFASLTLNYIAEVRLLIPYKILRGNKMSLRCNRCAGFDTTETAQKQRMERESPKSTAKRVSSLKRGLPDDTDFLGGQPARPSWDPQGRGSHQAIYWLVPASRHGSLPGDGGRARAGQVPSCPLGKHTEPFEPPASPHDASTWQGPWTRGISLIRCHF